MATEEDVAAGLIDWINSFDTKAHVSSVNDLNDGETLWAVLQQIDGFSFPGLLPEPPEPSSPTSPTSDVDTSWIRKWNNLKHLYDALTLFLIEECGQRLPLFTATSGGRTRPDLKAIAQHSSLPDSILLLKLCVVAAINCADRIEFLKKMQELGERTQEVLMTTAQEAGEGDDAIEEEEGDVERRQSMISDDFDNSTRYSTSGAGGLESDLASEERLGKVIADNQRIALEKREIQRQLDDLYQRFQKLQQKHDRSQEELSETNDRLTAVLSGKVDGAQNKAADQKSDTIIAALESRVVAAESEVEELRKTNEVLKIKADRVQKLQDDYDEIKIDRDKLSRKANTAEKYRQKLESIQDMEKENQTLKTKVGELQTQIKQSDSSRASSSNLQREIDEYRRLLPSIEQERYDLNEMKKQLEFDYHTLEARYHDVNDQLTRSQGQVEDLQGRLRDYEDGGTPSTPPKREVEEPKDWEKEEAEFAEAEARLTAALLESSNSIENKDKDKDGKDNEKGENEDGITEDELRAIMSAMRAQAQAGTAHEKETGIRTQKRLLVAIEKQRSKNTSLADHVRKQSDLIAQMRQSIDEQTRQRADAEKPSSPPPPPPDPPSQDLETIPPPPVEQPRDDSRLAQILEINENLKREIRLMTSAWYEQNQRLSSANPSGGNAVMMMRSRLGGYGSLEEPRSFLGRQRRVVDSAVLGSSSTQTSQAL